GLYTAAKLNSTTPAPVGREWCYWQLLASSPRQVSPAGESKNQKRGGETWRGLSKFRRITDVYGRKKYHLWFSVSQNSNCRPK
ncbi:hypothetical protein K443DRAFT_632658, partial [Laccaria amethystina LaAM-08-1]